jgi:hypothetical protein
LFYPDQVRSIWREHMEGRSNRQHELWNVLMLQAWLDEQKVRSSHPVGEAMSVAIPGRDI